MVALLSVQRSPLRLVQLARESFLLAPPPPPPIEALSWVPQASLGWEGRGRGGRGDGVRWSCRWGVSKFAEQARVR